MSQFTGGEHSLTSPFTRRISGVTLIELFVIGFVLTCGVVGAAKLGACWGAIGYVAGFVGGGAAPIVTVWSLFGFDTWSRNGHPMMPPCVACSGTDYETDFTGEDLIWRCTCGETYSRDRARGLRTARIRRADRDGRLVPHRRWAPFRGWVPDESA